MNRAPHPLLAGLWREGAAPAQALARWQAQGEAIDALAQGLQRIGLDADAPWAPLLRLPLADGDAGLRSALQALANAQSDPLPADTPAAARRPSAAALPGAARSAAAMPRGSAIEGSRATIGAAVPIVARPGRSSAASVAPRPITPAAAAAFWQQRAQRAGLDHAFNTPLRSDGHRSAAQATGWAGSIAAARPLPATAAAVDPAASVSPLPAEAPSGLQPATQRIELLLARLLQRPAETAPARSPVAATSRVMAMAAARPVIGDFSAAAQPAAAASTPGPHDAGPGSAPGFGGGLRGLAARAAAMASGSTVGAASAQPAAAPSQDAAWPGESAPHLPDDERLTERLAQLLKREALRDGIDLSGVRP